MRTRLPDRPHAITGRYNEILFAIAENDFEPIFWERDGTPIAADWAEGFVQAMAMRLEVWRRIVRVEA